MKGKISEDLEKILRDDNGRDQLRRSLISGKDCSITIGNKHYRVSTKNSVAHSFGKYSSVKSQSSGKANKG